ncbi:polyhydroxyalkanoic acid system family protein [uncultured Oxalicibacterium sp.]|uniref:polyhydroxyalkanoic acid system family protein n=1 Tax=uncultured Oxalicibacterium sp. TaxID=1168540 RepID=UPI0025F945BC|nr:polyhydroxyalkanoic acid system family protein [uncultured Oxalicibacterium sp.]
MADISIRRTHQLAPEAARDAAQQLADRMVNEFEMQTEWQGDVLSFQRSGVSGTLALQGQEAQVDVTLDFLFKAFASTLEEKIVRNMDRVFGAAA